MTWVRIDDRTATHPKLRDVGPEAAWLWLCGLCWCNGHHTDGAIRKVDLDALSPGTWSGKQLAALVSRLVSVRMWIDEGEVWRVHDYDEYQSEALRESVDERREYERERKRAQRAAKKAQRSGPLINMSRGDSPGHVPGTAAGQSGGTGTGQSSGTDLPPSHPSVPTPRPGPARPGPEEKKGSLSPRRDPSATVTDLPGVSEVHEAWKASCGLTNHRFRNAFDVDAMTIADAINAYGLADCLLVANNAPNDGMVSGKTDEKGKKHNTIRYIFGNADAFNRILHAAQERAGKSSRKKSAREAYEEACSR